MRVNVCVYAYEFRYPQKPEVLDSPGTGVKGDCEPLDVGAVN